MAEQNPNPTFQWRSQADKPALPTDYTPSALAATWGFHHDTIAKYITMHPIFDPFYQWMRYANKEVVGSSPYKHRGIPAELEPFFHAYLDFLFPANEANKVNNETSINEQERLFSLNLYQKAVAAEKAYEKDHIGSGEAQPTNSNEDNAVHSGLYWYRRLYENPHFQNAVSGDYWRKEYAWRCQLIEELSLQLPQVQQIHELKTMISYMDIRIAYLLCCVERSTESNEIETQSITLDKSGFEFEDSFLSTFPPQLIHSMRNTNRKVDPRLLYTKRTEYIIPNIPIHIDNPKIKDMKDAFNLISKPKTDSAIRRDVQSKYLNLVCDIPAKSDFQKASEDLQNYLNLYSTTDHDLETYNRFIVNCCFRTYRNIMWYSIPMIDDVMGQPINDAALQQFVETSVSNFYNLFYYPIAHIVSFTQSAFRFDIADYCERHRKAIEQLISQGQSTKESLYKSWADTFKSNIFGLWPTEIFGPTTILDSEFSDETIAYVSSTMAQYCHDANQGYGVMINWESEDLFRRAWRRFFETQSLEKETIPAYGHTLDILLTAGLLITKTWVSMNYSHQTTLRMFKELTAYINNRNGRPPKAACQDSAVT